MGSVIGGDPGSQYPVSSSPVEVLHFKKLTFLISAASLVTLCMFSFSGLLAQGGSKSYSHQDVLRK